MLLMPICNGSRVLTCSIPGWCRPPIIPKSAFIESEIPAHFFPGTKCSMPCTCPHTSDSLFDDQLMAFRQLTVGCEFQTPYWPSFVINGESGFVRGTQSAASLYYQYYLLLLRASSKLTLTRLNGRHAPLVDHHDTLQTTGAFLVVPTLHRNLFSPTSNANPLVSTVFCARFAASFQHIGTRVPGPYDLARTPEAV